MAYVRKPGSGSEKLLYQHDAYCRALLALGFDVRALRHDTALPPARCFLSDAAVISESIAIIGRLDDAGQHAEEAATAAALLGKTHFIKCINAPGRLDGGDVVRLGTHFFIATTARTNRTGAQQLAELLQDAGQSATVIDLTQYPGLRLSAAVCDLGGNRLLLHPALARHYAFLGFEKIIAPESETGACDAITTDIGILLPAQQTATLRLIKAHGLNAMTVDISEFMALGVGLSALSLRLPPRKTAITVLASDGLRRVI